MVALVFTIKTYKVLFRIGLAVSLLASSLCSTELDGRNKQQPGTKSDVSAADAEKHIIMEEILESSSGALELEHNKESDMTERSIKDSISDFEEVHVDRKNDHIDKIDTPDTSEENSEEKPQVSLDSSSYDKSELIADIEIKDDLDNLNAEITENETNSTWLSWVRYFLDPFLEEFKDGIYSRSNNSNSSDNNVSEVALNSTDLSSIVNETVPDFLNITDTEQNNTDASKKTKFQCNGKNVTENTNATVQIVTSSKLLQLLSFEKNETENVTDCLVVMFYAPWCHFCAKTAPYYNALSRAFPQLDFVAVDTAQFSNLLARFGTVSVPNILVFHQSRAAVKFNQTERTFENFVSFVKNTTGLEPNSTVNVTEADYIGPISSVPTDDPDIFLWIAWLFVILYSSFMFIKSTKGQQWITRIRVLWQEHQHID